MNRALFLTVTLIFLFAAVASAGHITRDLAAQLETISDDDVITTVVMLADQVDLDALNRELDEMHATRAFRHEMVVRTLQKKAEQTQGEFVRFLDKGATDGNVSEFTPFWIANLVVVEAKKSFILQIEDRIDVSDLYIDYRIEGIRPVSKRDAPGSLVASIEEGLERINAPMAWARGYTGAGRLVSHLDTGVEGTHPALADRWRGLHAPWQECWYDPVTGTTFPTDFGGHGTHTMGTTCGYEVATDDHIGVAYDAEWIAAAVIDRVDIPTTIADAITAFQWTADPDGDPGTVDDVPDVSSNSWGISPIYHSSYLDGPCDQMFWTVIDGCEAAGVVVVYAAGNEGNSPPNSIRNPANRAIDPYNSFCVGAINGADYGNDPIAYFSSWGPVPSECGSFTTKPEVSAPGENVRSSYPGGGYVYMSGTSMACPHVAGSVAVLRQADPNATSEQVKFALMESAQDLGPITGEDNTYGWGLIDLNAALDILGASGCWWELTCNPVDPPIIIPEEGGSFSFDASLDNHCDSTRITDVWSMVRLPDGTPYGPVLLFENVPFGPDMLRGVTGMTHNVPSGAPYGSYKYKIYYGDYPSAPEDSCSFNFYKQGGGSGGPYSVLILLSDYSTSEANNAINAIMADGRFTGVDVMDVQYTTPTLDDLLPYDIVQAWSNYPFADATALGNVLADFVDLGGAVLLSQFSFTSSWAIGGRMMSEYSPLAAGSSYGVSVSLGTYDPSHPIMLGVSSLAGYWAVDATPQGGAELVASWNNGYPCVAVNAVAPRVVALNMYFGVSSFQLSGDWDILLPNALAYAGDNSYLRVTGWEGNDFAAIVDNGKGRSVERAVKSSDLPATGGSTGLEERQGP